MNSLVTHTGPSSIPNALTIDVEDYYHVSAFESVVRFEDWDAYEGRIHQNTLKLLDLLAAAGVTATFFVLGWVAEHHPALVKAIHAAGHEVASHGYRHRLLYQMTPPEFREDTERSKKLLEDLCGKPVIGFRAPSYSIIRTTLWCLDVLNELGFEYDSSIFPIHHDRYGIPNFPRFPHRIRAGTANGVWEFPLSTVSLGNCNLPVAGGGYFRILPYAVTRWAIHRLNTIDHQPAVVYLHPWEIDPNQPRIRGPWISRVRHYANLSKTETKLRRLLRDFSFAPIGQILQRFSDASPATRNRAAPAGTPSGTAT